MQPKVEQIKTLSPPGWRAMAFPSILDFKYGAKKREERKEREGGEYTWRWAFAGESYRSAGETLHGDGGGHTLK